MCRTLSIRSKIIYGYSTNLSLFFIYGSCYDVYFSVFLSKHERSHTDLLRILSGRLSGIKSLKIGKNIEWYACCIWSSESRALRCVLLYCMVVCCMVGLLVSRTGRWQKLPVGTP